LTGTAPNDGPPSIASARALATSQPAEFDVAGAYSLDQINRRGPPTSTALERSGTVICQDLTIRLDPASQSGHVAERHGYRRYSDRVVQLPPGAVLAWAHEGRQGATPTTEVQVI